MMAKNFSEFATNFSFFLNFIQFPAAIARDLF